ncbi:DUF4214 domain-containing protein [Paenibacillus oceani]|uniref:DUF4214 domain-containing protein n=1 Tax=Paenibacillus oceani TaxID=2772510 RepID=A0A927C3X8_9BACL|nr:DUF4214 domain-containing protein [Paenibacillus oceani]MBD2860879.1 DUF4214 domain-containing protein [Paenibacillus oceani]
MSITRKLHKIVCLDEQPFLAELYRSLLNREPDEPGLANHARALRQGVSKHQLLVSFLISDEALSLYEQPPPANKDDHSAMVYRELQRLFNRRADSFVSHLYRDVLCREPDRDSYNSYLESLAKGRRKSSVFKRFVTSAEFESLIRMDKYTFTRHVLDQLIQSFYK